MTYSNRLKYPRLLIFLGLMALGLLSVGAKTLRKPSPDPAVVAADPDVHAVAAANTDFGFRMLAQLNRDTPDKNIFFSPFSVSDALTMTLNGAGGATQTDITSTLGLQSLTVAQINHANGLLLPSLENPDPKVELSVANALWADIGTTFDGDFQQRCREFYEARTDMLDFHSPTAADTINDWVKANTHGKIDQLVSAEDLKPSPAVLPNAVLPNAVLTNAVYFHGEWSHKFDPSGTRDAPFTLASGGTKTVPLMSQEGNYSYLETPQFQAVSLPYGTGRMSLYVFLPAQSSSLMELTDTLNGNSWTEWVGKMQPAQVTLFLPRFKAKYRVSLKEQLSALGMASTFRDGADFTPMGLHDSFISDVIHKATLEVDEQGTVAAAATGVIWGQAGAALPPPTIMRVDRPFFCAIRDNTTGTLLFAGVIRDPQ